MKSIMKKRVAVIGAGSWGTALAILLADKGYDVCLWGRRREYVEEMLETRENRDYLPGVKIPYGLQMTWDLEKSILNREYIVLVVPSHSMRQMVSQIRPFIDKNAVIISASKGLEVDTLKRMSEVIKEELHESMHKNVAAISGPSHAEEVSKGLPTTVVAAAPHKEIAESVQDLFITSKFRVYTNPDIIGVELGGALKNIIALGAGISDGLGFGDNTKAALMTRGIAEIARLGIAMGAEPLTFAGLSGIGDLIVTCTSIHSRNRRAGILIGQGKTLDEIYSNTKMVIEGVRTTKAAYKLQKEYNIEMPITSELYKVLFEAKNPLNAVKDLMERGRTHEIEEVAMQKSWHC